MNQSSGGVESRHANQRSETAPGVAIRRGCSPGDGYGYGAGCSAKRGAVTTAPIARIAGVAPGPLDLFIRYRRVAILALIVLLGLARWIGDGGIASW